MHRTTTEELEMGKSRRALIVEEIMLNNGPQRHR